MNPTKPLRRFNFRKRVFGVKFRPSALHRMYFRVDRGSSRYKRAETLAVWDKGERG